MKLGQFLTATLTASLVAGSALGAEVVIRWGDVVGGTHPQVQMIDRWLKRSPRRATVESRSSPSRGLSSAARATWSRRWRPVPSRS